MDEGGLRERKKQQTRQLIAQTAARLFAERGYEQVAIVDVARNAQVAEKTVYNYFPTKEALVVDLEQPLRKRLVELIRTRPAAASPAAVIRSEALAFVESIRTLSPEQVRGGLGHLGALSPTIRRLSLEMTDRLGSALGDAIFDTTDLNRYQAHLEGISLGWVFQLITDETGQQSRDGQSPAQIADAIAPIIEGLFDRLPPGPSAGSAPAVRSRRHPGARSRPEHEHGGCRPQS
jgi:AcrR family transcriptional regulator